MDCEKCGSEMVIRKSATGRFWGCQDYPDCKHTVPIKGKAVREKEEGEAEVKPKVDWDAKDLRIVKESLIASASRVVAALIEKQGLDEKGELKGQKPSELVIGIAKKWMEWIYPE